LQDRYQLTDTKQDILSHKQRKDAIHILTLDPVLARDIYARIRSDARLKRVKLIRPPKMPIRETVNHIEDTAPDTVSSRLLIFDVRKLTLPKQHRCYNKIVGYNRRDFNQLCYTVLIGDGPLYLFQTGKSLDIFVSHLSAHRVDYHPAVFFYDPFLHYEPGEIPPPGIDEEFVLPDVLPQRLAPYFQEGQDLRVDSARRFFRATQKDEQIKAERLEILRRLYKKRIAEQFPHHQEQLQAWLSREGIGLASERLHLYPLFFEDWVYELLQKARTPEKRAK
jgi:hypothetical protein